jgi:hypothetical protein
MAPIKDGSRRRDRCAAPIPKITVSSASTLPTANNNQTIAAFAGGQDGENLARLPALQIQAMQKWAVRTASMML